MATLSPALPHHWRLQWLPSWLHAILSRHGERQALPAATTSIQQLIAAGLPESPSLVIELGTGDDRLTRQLLRHRARAQDLIVVAPDWQSASQLALQFPSVEILAGSPENLIRFVELPPHAAGAIVCSFNLRALSWRQHYRILTQAFRLLSVGGVVLYPDSQPSWPVHERVLQRLGLATTSIGNVWRIERISQ